MIGIKKGKDVWVGDRTIVHAPNNGRFCLCKEFVLMEYTGLKDKKRTKEFPEGQEIYENDICRWNNSSWIGVMVWSNYKWMHKVKTPKGTRCYELTNGLDMYDKEDIGKRFEVIGNIHENKNLLDNK